MLVIIITIIFIILTVISIAIILPRELLGEDGSIGMAVGTFMISLVLSVICIVSLICIYAHVDVQKENIIAERESLIYRLEKQNDTELGKIGNEELFKDILHFNEEIREKQYWNKNLWTNCFIPDFYDEIELINYKAILENNSSPKT